MNGPADEGRPTHHPKLDPLDPPQAIHDHYRSVDSTPPEYSLDRPPSVVNGFLVTFAALSLLTLLAVVFLAREGPIDQTSDIVFFPSSGDQATIPVRLFVLNFFWVFSLYMSANAWRRALVFVELSGGVLVAAVLTDLCCALIDQVTAADISAAAQQILGAAVAMVLFPVVIMRNAYLPDPVELAATGRTRVSSWMRLLIPLAIAIVLATVIDEQFDRITSLMRDIALLGGVGLGIFLVQQIFVIITAGIGSVLIWRSRRVQFTPPIAVVVPAHNEAHGIAQTISGIDRAAGVYPGAVRLYIVDNVSTDDTAARAQQAIDLSDNLEGTVLFCPTPGKAHALNYGMDRVQAPFVVRVDADVVLADTCLTRALRHFADDRVAAVGGMPLPAEEKTFIERGRLVEVLVRHGFFQVARVGYDGLIGMPGMFTAFRSDALAQVGPFTPGINGEDTDICVRFTSLGYLGLVEPTAEYRAETPRSWAHLNEQRIRWFRSAYHVAAHNRGVLLRGYSMAGALSLPFSLVSSVRRAMLVPLLIFAMLVLGLYSSTFLGLRWQAIVAMVIGLPALVAAVVCLLLGRPRAVLCIPDYLVLRLCRSYFTLAAILTLRFLPLESPWRRRRLLRRPPGSAS